MHLQDRRHGGTLPVAGQFVALDFGTAVPVTVESLLLFFCFEEHGPIIFISEGDTFPFRTNGRHHSRFLVAAFDRL